MHHVWRTFVMEQSNNIQEELNAKRKQNEKLLESIHQKRKILEEKQAQLEDSTKELNQLKSQLHLIKQGKLWNAFKHARRAARRHAAYLSGRRNRREIIDPSIKKKKAKRQIKKLKYNLNELGFEKKALFDLERIFQTTDNRYLKKLAAWELALWHANKYSKEGAIRSLFYLSEAKRKTKDKDFLRKIAIMEAECHLLLNQIEEGKDVIRKALMNGEHADLYLAAANLESTIEEKLKWINRSLDLYGMEHIAMKQGNKGTLYDGLTTYIKEKKAKKIPKVSIIIPVYNDEKGIVTAMKSVLKQTWTNLEVLVVDDCSTDNTVNVVEDFAQKDSRVKLLSTGTNSGAYVARNTALQMAVGEFVTINDADDWSHPEKIEAQATHLLENAEIIANTSQQARLTDDFMFYRRGKAGQYIFANMSSLMFRREEVMERLGYWDSVRFGADGEFKKRLKKAFGDDCVVDLSSGPYSFQRQSSHSLTGNAVFGYHGYFTGARKEYLESYLHHQKNAANLYYPFPMEKRLFPAPEPMLPNREEKSNGKRHFDVVIASDFRLLGGTNMSNIEEIKAQKKLGLRTGLIQMSRYDFHSEKQMNPGVRELVDGENVQVLVYGEKITCDVLIVRHPPILQEWQKYLPKIETRRVCVIVNQPPKREYSQKGRVLYDIKRCANHLKGYVGTKGKWYPIGPLIRETLLKEHMKDLKSIKLASDDWVNIIHVDEWKRASYQKGDKIRIGRHSRDQYVKWPDNKNDLLSLYPDSPEYEIHVLGGAESPKKILGDLPSNWRVYEFGELTPKDFLANLDVFVYYTYPDWVEAFGRVIFEAMAVGVPVILPPSYEKLFGEAAIYASANEVLDKINDLMTDEKAYQAQVEKAFAYVEENFGYTKHAQRLEDCFVDKLVSV